MQYKLANIFTLSHSDIEPILVMNDVTPSFTLNGNRALVAIIYYNFGHIDPSDHDIVTNPKFYEIMTHSTNIESSFNDLRPKLIPCILDIILTYLSRYEAYVYNKVYPHPKLAMMSVGITDEIAIRESIRDAWLSSLSYFYEMKLLKESAMDIAASYGHISIVQWLWDRDICNVTHAVEQACQGGYTDLLEWFLQKGVSVNLLSIEKAAFGGKVSCMEWIKERRSIELKNLNDALYEACIKNRSDAIKWLINNGANDMNNALKGAAKGGNIKLMKWAKKKGASRYVSAMFKAAENSNVRVMKWIARHGGFGSGNWSEGLTIASSYGNLNVIRWIIRKRPNDYLNALKYADSVQTLNYLHALRGAFFTVDMYNEALIEAVETSDIPIMEWFIEKGATDLDVALCCAAYRGSIESMECLAKHGANAWDLALCEAVGMEHIKAAQWLVDKGASNFDEAMDAARESKSTKMEKWIIATRVNSSSKL